MGGSHFAPSKRAAIPKAISAYYNHRLIFLALAVCCGFALHYLQVDSSSFDSLAHSKAEEAIGRELLDASDYTAYNLPPTGVLAPPLPPGKAPRTLMTLKFSNLWQDDRYEKTLFGNAKMLVELFIFVAATIMTMIIFVNILSCYVLPNLPAYRELDVFGQLAVTTNMLYVIILVLQTVPYTVVIIGILFGDAKSREFPPFYAIVFVFITTHALLYAYEGVVRSIVKVNYFLLVHHMMFFVLVITEFVDQSNFVVKTCMILDYFVVWESGLFLTNVCYRLHVNYQLMKWVMICGTTIHGVTHFIQAMLLTTYFVAMGMRIDEYHINLGVYIFMVLLCTFLVGYQYYLEHIFYIMWIKVVKAQRKKEKDLEEAEEEDDEEGGEDKKAKEEASLIRAGSGAPPARVSASGFERSSTLNRVSITERERMIAEESTMLGELPTFPASMAARHMPRAHDPMTLRQMAEEEKTPLIAPQDKKSNSSPPNSNGGANAATAAATVAIVASSSAHSPAAGSSSGLPPLPPKPVDGVEATKPKKKKRPNDGLTAEMWEMTED